MEILRLLQASFDWDSAFHSVSAAMAVLQSGGDVEAVDERHFNCYAINKMIVMRMNTRIIVIW